jgi:hypothetical protein
MPDRHDPDDDGNRDLDGAATMTADAVRIEIPTTSSSMPDDGEQGENAVTTPVVADMNTDTDPTPSTQPPIYSTLPRNGHRILEEGPVSTTSSTNTTPHTPPPSQQQRQQLRRNSFFGFGSRNEDNRDGSINERTPLLASSELAYHSIAVNIRNGVQYDIPPPYTDFDPSSALASDSNSRDTPLPRYSMFHTTYFTVRMLLANHNL